MVERRLHERQLVDARVRLYHPVHGPLDGMIRDMSGGGVFISLEEIPEIHPGNGDGRFELKLMNMDVIFDMECIRLTNDGIVLIFVEEELEDGAGTLQ